MAGAEQFQEKCEAVFRPELPQPKKRGGSAHLLEPQPLLDRDDF
jgi:hypothetical protein